MTIKWLGHACFMISHSEYDIVIDPYNYRFTTGYDSLHIEANEVLISHEHYGHNCRDAVKLKMKPENSPFTIEVLDSFHDNRKGIIRGTNKIHIISCDGLRVAHMGDIGTVLSGTEKDKLANLDAIMIGAGSCTALPAQDAWRLCEEINPRIIIPMHYRFEGHGARRLEHIENFTGYFPDQNMICYYNSDSINITNQVPKQIAILKYMGK